MNENETLATNNNDENLEAKSTELKNNDESKTSELFNEFENSAETSQKPESEKPDNETAEPENEQKALTNEDIKLADGVEYDNELGESFLSILNEAKIGKETAQKLVDLYQAQCMNLLKGMEAAENEKVKKFNEDLENEKAEWLKQCQADKEFGGQNWDANQAIIDKAAREFAGAVKVMQAYNLQFNPEIVRMFYRAGKLISEDNSIISGNGRGKEENPAQAIFGDSLKEYIQRRENN